MVKPMTDAKEMEMMNLVVRAHEGDTTLTPNERRQVLRYKAKVLDEQTRMEYKALTGKDLA